MNDALGSQGPLIERIAFEDSSQLDRIFVRLGDNLRQHVDAVLAKEKQNSLEFRRAVETIVLDEFLRQMKHIAQANITIAGKEVQDGEPSQATEAFDEALSKAVLQHQNQVHDSVCDNIKRRKQAPARALAQIATAAEHAQAAQDTKESIFSQELQALRDRKRLVNATLPDRDTVISQYSAALKVALECAESANKQRQRAQEAILAQKACTSL